MTKKLTNSKYKDFVSTSPASEVEDSLTTIGRNPHRAMTVKYLLQPVVIHLHSHFSVGSGGSIALIKNPLNDCSIHSVDNLRQLHESHNCQICHPTHRSGIVESVKKAYWRNMRQHHHFV
jgi:hypothetical protein